YRLAHRKIAGPGDENVSIWSLNPPGFVHADSVLVEVSPNHRPNSSALILLGVVNSATFDYLLCLRVRANVLAFIRESQPIPINKPVRLLSHSTLRLTCNHSGYEPLWCEQLETTWHESKPPLTWPVLATDDERWEVRAAIDAVVADAYGLNRE